MKYFLFLLILLSKSLLARNDQHVVNVYAWGGEIPKQLIQNFEHETGIKVNFSTYDSNETLYAKLRATQESIYDVILPSAYYVERMQKLGYLSPLDKAKLPHIKNLSKTFTQHDYDPNNQYSIPLIWGTTGIFYNQHWVKRKPQSWRDLWNKKWRHQLMILDDPREAFAMALLSLGYSIDDADPQHIQEAFEALKQLAPNIKLFANESIQAILIDEDAPAGIAWNGDVYKAQQENKAIQFIYPKEGFIIWIDCLSIPKNPPHEAEAYAFIDYLLRAKSAATIAQIEGHAITNEKGIALLPYAIKSNTLVYPDKKTLKRGMVQRDIGENAISLYHNYWQALKLSL